MSESIFSWDDGLEPDQKPSAYFHSRFLRRSPAPGQKKAVLRLTACNTVHTGPLLSVYPGMVKLEGFRKSSLAVGGKRGKISGFSKAARRRMLDFFAMLRKGSYPRFWQDFTFPDELMIGLTTRERKELARCVWARFRKRILRRFPMSWGLYRKEWVTRKSGLIVGERCPHFHLVYDIPGVGFSYEVSSVLATMWVECLGDLDPFLTTKALSVALHPNSYREIQSYDHARNYVSKYVAKVDSWDDPDQGKHWGTFGVVPLAPAEEEVLTDDEARFLRRVLRRVPRKKRWRRAMAKRNSKLLKVYCSGSEIQRCLSWIQYGPCPF